MQQDEHPERHTCWWCGLPAEGYKLVQKAVVRKKDGVPSVIKAAEHAPACALHLHRLVEAEDPAVLRGRNANRAKQWKTRQERLV